MTPGNSATSPLEAAAGAAGPHTTEAFKLLGDETRLAILLGLWEAYDPGERDNAVSFSELYDRVNAGDSGNFTYHLDKLTDHFVAETEDGYILRDAGHKIVRGVIAGAGLDDTTLEPTAIDRSCHRCGASVELSYEGEHLYQRCTNCAGNIGPTSTERAPEGTLHVCDFFPAGLTDRTPAELFVAGTAKWIGDVGSLVRGVCPECSGAVEGSLHICGDHAISPGTVCEACGSQNDVRSRYVCTVCKNGASFPASAAVIDHPAVIAFRYNQGLELTYDLEDSAACSRLWDHLMAYSETVQSEDPLRVEIRVPGADATLALTVDGAMSVRDIDHVIH